MRKTTTSRLRASSSLRASSRLRASTPGSGWGERGLTLLLAAVFAVAGCDREAGRGIAGTAAVTDPAWHEGLGETIEDALAEWRVPGGSVAVVTPEGIVFAEGFGTRDVSDATAVDPDTVFALESVSKTFTAAALARLVDAGAVGWDDPVIEHVPTFGVGDPDFTTQITIRDFLTHRSGLPAHASDRFVIPRILAGKGCTKKDLFAWMRDLKPAHALRERDAYSNLGYVVLAEVVEQVSGKSYAEFLHDELFMPLGMTRTVVGAEAFGSLDNRASPHDLDPEAALVPMPLLHAGECATGSGNIFGSARDLGVFLRMLLAGGAHGDARFLKAGTVAEMLRRQTEMESSAFQKEHYESDFAARTLGWEVLEFKGTTLVRMGGVGPGFQSHVALLPEEGVGVVALQNFSPALFHVSVAYTVLDGLRGAPGSDWTAVFRSVMPRPPERAEMPLPADRLADYPGTFTVESEVGGMVREIVLEEGKLYLLGTSPVGGGPPGVGRARLFGLEPDVLFIKTADAVFRFHRGPDGAVVGFDESFHGEHHFSRMAPSGTGP